MVEMLREPKALISAVTRAELAIQRAEKDGAATDTKAKAQEGVGQGETVLEEKNQDAEQLDPI
jgi:hypothetical protein